VFSMFNSLQQFEEIGTKKMSEVIESFIKDPKDMASLVYGIQKEVIALGLAIIKETLEECNQALVESPKRRQEWEVVKTDIKQLVTSLGTIEFEKTLFKRKGEKERCYLLDRIMNTESKNRLSEDAEAALLKEAVQTSYRRGGEAASLTDKVSKQTVKNKIHKLKFPTMKEEPKRKKVVEYLYIDADEDHVKLQFNDKKGDLVVGENSRKNNGIISKLVYVYEGVEPVAPRSKRNRLINPYTFSGVYSGEDNNVLWDQVYQYIENTYDMSKIKKIYLNADGGGWIKAGEKRLAGVTFVLDEFHLNQYLFRMTSHMLDSTKDAVNELRRAIRRETKKEFLDIVERLEEQAKTPATLKRISEGSSYILSNWMAARRRLLRRDKICGCSAEGHVSHILSARMSSRPMGWSRLGVDKMSHLRAYVQNKGDLLELVRFQREELPKAVGYDYDLIIGTGDIRSNKKAGYEAGKYEEAITHSVGESIKKKVWFSSHIWGL